MFKVFTGEWRGLGDRDDGFGLIVDFRFREIAHEFTAPNFFVFMMLALHTNKNGECFPGYKLLMKETGLARATIAKALNELTAMTIQGRRVLLRINRTSKVGKTTNLYIIFPKDQEIEEYEKMILKKSNAVYGKTALPPMEDEDSSANEPTLSSPNEPTHSSANELKVKPEDLKLNHPLSDMGAGKAPAPASVLEVKKLDWVDCALKYQKPADWDFSHFPEDVRPIIEKFCGLWRVSPPVKVGRGGEFAQWIREGRAVREACGELGLPVMDQVFEKWKKDEFTVGHPGALTKTLKAVAGAMRQASAVQAPAFDPAIADYVANELARIAQGVN